MIKLPNHEKVYTYVNYGYLTQISDQSNIDGSKKIVHKKSLS